MTNGVAVGGLLTAIFIYLNMEKKITEPTEKEKKTLDSIVENAKDYVEVRGRKWGVRWIRNRARRKVTSIMNNEKDEDKVVYKCAAALRLNGFFKITFFYWFLWRWYYYVKQYSEEELVAFIDLCKKKVPVEGYLIATMLLTGMRDDTMNMTREEVNRILRERTGGQRGR